MNTFGRILRLTTFGESHGAAIGGVLDGFPAGLEIDPGRIQDELDQRKPSRSIIGSGRQEKDKIEILSGVYQGKSLGSPIAFLIRNQDARNQNYEEWKNYFRPSHADDTYYFKYGIRDPHGGGRASARETACRVAAGSMSGLILEKEGIEVYAYTRQIHCLQIYKVPEAEQLHRIYEYETRCPDEKCNREMLELLKTIRNEHETVGGVVEVVVKGMPRNLGEPIYDKLPARLASAMMSINASRGFEIGEGFSASTMTGGEHNDLWEEGLPIRTRENHSGGVRGGISTGEDLIFRVAFKPIPTRTVGQDLIDKDGKLHNVEIEGRHDVCCVPRAVPVVKAMTSLVLADFILLGKATGPF